MNAAVLARDPDSVPCPRFSATLSLPACAARWRGAQQRFPLYALTGCRGCALGQERAALVPVASLTQRRPSETFRLYERCRTPQRRAELWPDRVQR